MIDKYGSEVSDGLMIFIFEAFAVMELSMISAMAELKS